MPEVRPFRALRYRSEAVEDLARVVSPPYDVVSPAAQRVLLDRHPRNVVRLDLPEVEPGEDPDERYRRAARTLAAWRSDGTLHKDPRPSIYAYEQATAAPDGGERIQRGFFARLKLEPLTAGSGVRPHEQTLAGPREDRYRLLRATGVNTSPVVVLHDDAGERAARVLADIAAVPADVEVMDDDGVRHRMWTLPEDARADEVAALVGAASSGPVTIADGHHRYETALRYRDERRMSRSCEEDPPFDYLLALFLSAAQPLTVLPTHRVVLGLDVAAPTLSEALGRLAAVRTADRSELMSFGAGAGGGRGRFGLWTCQGAGFLLDVRPDTLEPWPAAVGPAVRRLDVAMLGAVLDRLGVTPEEVTTGSSVRYTKSAAEAIEWVDAGLDGATMAFLLEPTPVAAILEVAAAGEVMPQKSTYFHPKPLTGLVINPHEW